MSLHPNENLRAALKEKLAASNALTGSPEADRAAASIQLCAAVDAFYLAGIDLSKLGPLRRLLGALEDADRGIRDPILTPSCPSSRPPDFSRKWEARATAVVAYEVLGEVGIPASRAAQQVNREFRLSGFKARFIRSWRD
jgi:hypothetical protein